MKLAEKDQLGHAGTWSIRGRIRSCSIRGRIRSCRHVEHQGSNSSKDRWLFINGENWDCIIGSG